MTPFSTVVIGNESLLVQCCDRLLAEGHAIAAVVTRNPDVADWAKGQGLRVERPGRDLAARLEGLAFDWLLSIANLDIIPDEVLKRARKGAVNFHDGPLPRHAGLNAPVWALIAGEPRHGITWHLIEGGVDEGRILVQRYFDIAPTDTALTLNTKCYEAAIDSFGTLMSELASGAPQATDQDLSQRTYHALRDRPRGQGVLDWTRPATELERLVRAMDHGPYWNPLTTAKLFTGSDYLIVGAGRCVDGSGVPGQVLAMTDGAVTIACATGAIELSDLRDLSGASARPETLIDTAQVLPGAPVYRLDAALPGMIRHESHWRARLAQMAPLVLDSHPPKAPATETRALPIPGGLNGAAQIAAALAKRAETGAFDLAYTGPQTAEAPETAASWLPLAIKADATFGALSVALQAALDDIRDRAPYARDLVARAPELSATPVPTIGLAFGDTSNRVAPVTFVITDSGVTMEHAAGDALAETLALRIEQLSPVLAPDTAIADLPALTTGERDVVLNRWNDTETPFDTTPMHRLFEAQVDRTPDAPALVFERQTVTYHQLDARANRIAHVLRDMGVGPDTVVGLATQRSVDMVAGALGILKAGGAYLPLDPSYPADRLQHYITDSRCPVIVTQSGLVGSLPQHDALLLQLDADPRLTTAPDTVLPDTAGPENLAYMIYTSGSTGTPKGVMVEHRNAANFYRGMDDRITHKDGGTWLAVTSLSFDISVLELFYTLARGFKVVLTSDADRAMISNGPLPQSGGGMQFSLYYWGNDDGVGPDKYKTLIEGAKFADDNGFVAVWTPERHFHAFGGPYPNPSVTGAAVAGVTRNIGVRAGSCVAPLHHPARIAEEWAVIDNLTNGRAGLAIASGWQPDDFVLRPENTPPDNKPAMIDSIDTLRRLWRGEAVGFPRKDGTMHEVVTQPRPVSKDLPVWVTTAGNPETWKEAGRLGANVLTHLLGQSVDEVEQKIGLYHDALRDAGHDPRDFTVTLMLHTFLAATRDQAREIAREPMKDYLRSAAGLIKQYAWAFPAFKRPEGVKNPFELDLGSLSDEDLEGILDFAFERYFNDSGLFGTVEDAMERVAQVRKIGVTEIACLIDYGIDADTVLDGLRPLAEVVRRNASTPELAEDDFSIAAQIVRHKVTHLQCTPSMARMFAMNDEARLALSGVQHLYFGGEPLPGALVRDFADITDAPIENMYGPTETTIWSSTRTAPAGDGVVDIGTPIANTQLYVLDDTCAPVAVGQPGELWIGGSGVTRGYWNRPELTAERFVDNPFHGGRMYRTGDLVRRRGDGRIDFLGRVDHQIKLRGFRIELGEIEAALENLPGIAQAVVVAREDTPGDLRLVGYYRAGSEIPDARLKAGLADRLPDYMVPGRFMRLDAFPLTPNKKVDRNALPEPVQAKLRPTPQTQDRPSIGRGAAHLEPRIAEIWSQVLGVTQISGRDNFFDLGGHSLLAVQAHRAIRDQLGVARLSITDIFRFPVLAQLAGRVGELSETVAPAVSSDGPRADDAAGTAANERALTRRDAMTRRREMRARRSA